MKPSEASRRLGIKPSTIRLWSNLYRDFFSPTGAGGEGHHRAFTEHDTAILNFIKTQKDSGASPDELLIRLKALAASEYADLPDAPEAFNVANNVPMIPRAAADAALNANERALLREVSFLERRIDELRSDHKEQLNEMRADHAADRQKVESLTDQLARAQTELELWRAGRLQRREDDRPG